MGETLTITFDPALRVEGADIPLIVLREPTAGEVLESEKVAVPLVGVVATRASRAALISKVSGVSPSVVSAMPNRKIVEAGAFLDRFYVSPDPGEQPNLEPDMQIPIVPTITRHNREYDCLDLREPTSGEMDAAVAELGTSPTAYSMRKMQIMIVAKVSGYSRDVIQLLPISTIDTASRYLLGFM